jgi:hypothetical protein
MHYFDNNNTFDSENDSYIELTVDESILQSNSDLISKTINLIKEFFNENTNTLG